MTLSIYIAGILGMIMVVVVAGVLAPMGVLFNSQMFAAGEDILTDSLDEIADIDDTQVRSSVNSTVETALDAGAYNINFNANIFRYSWILAIIVIGLVTFIGARALVEYQRPGGFV